MARYIDKDIAVSIVRLCFSEHGKFETHSSLMNFICTSLSADVTTADVKPVVHAHWIKAFFPGSVECNLPILLDVTCSHCAFKMWELYPYCPNCGAKMDEEEDNE